MGNFFDKMALLEEEKIMDDVFEDMSWEGFRSSGYHPYNFGLTFFTFIFTLTNQKKDWLLQIYTFQND